MCYTEDAFVAAACQLPLDSTHVLSIALRVFANILVIHLCIYYLCVMLIHVYAFQIAVFHLANQDARAKAI